MYDGVAYARKSRSQEHLKANGMKQISVLIPLELESEKKKLGVSWRTLIARGLRKDNRLEEIKAQLEMSLQGNELLKYRVRNDSVKLREMEDLLKKAGLYNLNKEKED